MAAADPTTSPFIQGRHVYDYGGVLSANSVKTAEALATEIEVSGGGRIVLYTAKSPSDIPFTLATDWKVDGLLLTGEGDYGILTMGATLKATLADKAGLLSNPSPGEPTLESWMLTTLARADGLLRGARVFDGAGVLDAAGQQHAGAAANDLSGELGVPVYIDIAIGKTSSTSDASYNASMIRAGLGKSLVIALTVSDKQISGEVESDAAIFGKYHTAAPWSRDSLSGQPAANGDVQAGLLTAIDAVSADGSSNSGVSFEMVFWIVFTVVMVAIGVGSPFYGAWLIRKISGVKAPIKGGLPGDAVIESIADTGVTVSMPSVGPEAPEYKFGLQVTPASGGAPYRVEVKAFVPRLYIPMVVPGAQVGVLIDSANPMNVSIDFSRIGAASVAGAGGAAASGTMGFSFDANGQPAAGDVSALVGAVRSGALPSIKGSAAKLLATGTHGTAVITTAQPIGRTVRDIDPSADPAHLNDPMWLFAIEVSLAGEQPFPAVFGHLVPIDKVVAVAPGVKLAVAVNQANRNQEVAIDWDKSPIV